MAADAMSVEMTLSSEMESVEKELVALDKMEQSPEKNVFGKNVASHFSKTMSLLRNFRSEVRKITETMQKEVYENKLKDYEAKMKDLDKRIAAARKPPRKAEKNKKLTDDQVIMGADAGEEGEGFQNSNQVLDAATRAQQDTLNSLRRTEMVVNTTEDMGNTILSTLRAQTAKIEETSQNLDTLQGQLDRAKEDVRWFARQLAGDKCFLMCFMLVIIALAGVVFYRMYTGGDSDDGPATAPIPTPAPAAEPGSPPVIIINNPGAPPTPATPVPVITPPPPTTLTPVATLAPAETLAPVATFAPAETLAPDPETLAPS